MENKDLQAILNLRSWLMEKYNGLGKGANASYSQTPTKDVAALLEASIRDLDDILAGKVNFE